MYKNSRGDMFDLIKNKNILLFGCGKNASRYIRILEEKQVNVVGAFDNNKEKWGNDYYGLRILTWDEFVSTASSKDVVILITTHYSEIVRQLVQVGLYNSYHVDEIDFPDIEGYYNDAYFEWQKEIGLFGAKVKKKLFAPYIHNSDYICEFGCGGGYLLNEFSNPKIGVEINPYAIKNCNQLNLKVVSSVNALDEDSIDVVYSTMAFEHVDNPCEILRILRSKLKIGGRVIIHVPAEDSDTEYIPNDVNNHLYTWNPLTLGNMIKHAGYYVDEVRLIEGGWPRNYSMIFKELGENAFEEFEYLHGKVSNNKSVIAVGINKPY